MSILTGSLREKDPEIREPVAEAFDVTSCFLTGTPETPIED